MLSIKCNLSLVSFQYSWTPLLVSSMGNHTEVVNFLLERKPNVNALDQDGCTALTIACKEGYYDIANSLLNSGAYINIQVNTYINTNKFLLH